MFWLLAAAALLAPALVITEFKPWTLFEPATLKSTKRFISDFFPPKIEAEFLLMVMREAWRTVAIATVGMVLALIIAIPLTFISTSAISISALSGRMHALPFVLRQAIALTYGGMLGKVYGEILESDETHATHTLLRNGAGRMQAFFYGLLPQSAPELTSYTVYRWECAIRSSAVLGFVGAGGLGQQMDTSMKMFQGAEVATMLIVFMLLVALADQASAWLRKMLA